MSNPAVEVQALGQSIWQDFIRRAVITSGELQELVEREGLLGITSNPSIFEKAIAGSGDYDDDLRALVSKGGAGPGEIYERLALDDIRGAARVLEPAHRRTDGADGFVSFEVSPHLAHDTEATVREALRLAATIGRPNVMIKVPGTPEGIPAIERLTWEGVNVNVTLLFGLDAYEAAADAYVTGLERRAAAGRDVAHLASVASFFLSRIDTVVDEKLATTAARAGNEAERRRLEGLQGRAAISNAKLAYAMYRKLVSSPRWKALAARGARPQRLLWASTSTKNPRYPKLMYAEALIGQDTVDTLPIETFREFQAHGRVRPTLAEGLEAARETMRALASAGVSIDEVTRFLVEDGVRKFERSFDALIAAIERKREALLGGRMAGARLSLGGASTLHRQALDAWRDEGKVRRLWRGDASLWTDHGEDRWLGWLHAVSGAADHLAPFQRLATEARSGGFRHVLLLGMGGSSLFPWVLARTFERREGWPELAILDSTVPARIRAAERTCDPRGTLFVVASKSGTTVEPLALERHFRGRLRELGIAQAGDRFVAITDPGTPLEGHAAREHYRRVVPGDPTVGGRYSALTAFGLAPAALAGLDLEGLLGSAEIMVQACASCVPPDANPGVSLGLALGTLAAKGRDKVTLAASPPLDALGAWVEQLLAESTGKAGKGLIPIVGEALGPPEVYGNDRVFVHLSDRGAATSEEEGRLAALETAGHPVVRIEIERPLDLAQEVFRWEMATAVAGAVLRVNPFDQPDVESAKEAARRLLEELAHGRRWREDRPLAEGNGLALHADERNAAALGRPRADAEAILRAHLARLQPDGYLALLAWLEDGDENDRALQAARLAVRDARRVATTVGYGPRYLHSTGQLHKGGPGNGVFLVITADAGEELPVPGERWGFGALAAAQARGDAEELARRGRAVLRVHLGTDVRRGLDALVSLVRRAVS